MNFGFGSMMTGRFTGFDVYYEFVLSKFRCKKKEKKKLVKIETIVNPILGMKKITIWSSYLLMKTILIDHFFPF